MVRVDVRVSPASTLTIYENDIIDQSEILSGLKKMVERSFARLPHMKNLLNYIQEYPQRTKQLLGISYDQFVSLLTQAELRHAQQQAEIERIKIRLIAKGGGRKPKLTIPESV